MNVRAKTGRMPASRKAYPHFSLFGSEDQEYIAKKVWSGKDGKDETRPRNRKVSFDRAGAEGI
jgi:hypothetical protein